MSRRTHVKLSSLLVLALLLSAPMVRESIAQESEPVFVAGMLRAVTAEGDIQLLLPLLGTEVYIDVIGGIVHARVIQTFVNDTEYPLEAVYVFPLPARAAVTDMELVVGNRRIRSVVKEREEARQTYEQAKQEGKRTALLEQERPNIFTTSVANFMPGETVQVVFSYTEPAEYCNGAYSIVFPMVVGPRYIPFKMEATESAANQLVTSVPDAGRICPPVLPPCVDPGHRVYVEVTLRGLPVEEIRSSTHDIAVTAQADDVFVVTLNDDITVPNCDFALDVQLAENGRPHISFLESEGNEYAYGLLTILPPIGEHQVSAPPVPRDVVFLIDTSGSMDGESIEQAREGLHHCLDMLRPGDEFNIVRFSDDYSSMAESMLACDAQTLARARTFVAALEASGGTEMQSALKDVLRIPSRPGALRLIVFLTDGCVGDEDALMRLLSKRLGDARIFPFGIGSAPNEYLMRQMAELGRGQARFIRSQEDVGQVMADFFETLDSPTLTDIEVEWRDTSGVPAEGIVSYPNPVPDVFRNRPIQLATRIPAGFEGTLTVTGNVGNQRSAFSYDFGRDARQAYPVVDQAFGHARIQDLTTTWIRSGEETEREALRDEIVEVALRHQLVSRFTSRVAVEEIIEKAPDGTLLTVNVPSAAPRGSTLYATATQDMAFLLAGILAATAGALLWSVGRRQCRQEVA